MQHAYTSSSARLLNINLRTQAYCCNIAVLIQEKVLARLSSCRGLEGESTITVAKVERSTSHNSNPTLPVVLEGVERNTILSVSAVQASIGQTQVNRL